MQLKRDLKHADDQCLLLFSEVQKAWKLASSLQVELTNHETYIDKLQVPSFGGCVQLSSIHEFDLLCSQLALSRNGRWRTVD